MARSDGNGKIWYFTSDGMEVEIIMDTVQQVTLKMYNQGINRISFTTFVYSKCDVVERFSLWDDIYHLTNRINDPWIIGGDFNLVMNEEEKIGDCLWSLPIMQTLHVALRIVTS